MSMLGSFVSIGSIGPYEVVVFGMAAAVVCLLRHWRRADRARREAALLAAERRALRRSEARHRAVVDSASDAIVTVTQAGIIESFNRGAERIFGYDAAEAIGQPFGLLLPERLPGVRDTIAHCLANPNESAVHGRRLELAARHKGGGEFPIELSVTVVQDADATLFTSIIRDVTERKAFEGQLAHQASHDPLTSLPNRALFTDRLSHALARAARQQSVVAVLFLDLDGFKVVNDSLGHDVGDQLLVAVAERLVGCLRPGDTVARLGGDEFTVLLEDLSDARDAARVAERIIAALRAPFTIGGREVVISASIGIAHGAGEGEQAIDLWRNADIAMYRAKQAGKGRYEVFDRQMGHQALERLALEADLRRAIERREFSLVYQPKVELATGRIVGVEALVRWLHPERGVVPPSAFIPLAEETGLILPLGEWVLAEACRQACAWQRGRPGADALLMSVNLSIRQFQHPALVAEVARILAESGLEPGRLVLEITESVVTDDALATIDTLRRLKELGVQLAIDDFGTGYSSLSYLKSFPVDILKIDKSFIGGSEEAGGLAILSAVIGLARALGLTVVAEGVEKVEQLARLRALEAELGQGYLFSKPLTADAVGELLADRPKLASVRGVTPPRPRRGMAIPTATVMPLAVGE
jgi:diguanylate cyclase (GGDEF)-like protein/PAS domain S-box-containing protein